MDRPSALLEKILRPGGVRTVFQPIFEIEKTDASVFALESLSRGPLGSNVELADVLFEYVRRKRKEALVDLLCLKSAIRNSAAVCEFGKLFFNVHASTLAKDRCFVDGLESICSLSSFSPRKLAVEVVEHSPYWDSGEFVPNIRKLRDLGVQIAVDDLGVAYSSFKVILDVNPDYLKIDMYITRGCYEDRVRRAMLDSFVSLGNHIGARVIAEGIERPEDLAVLQSMGITLFQGYLLAKPQSVRELCSVLQNASFRDGSDQIVTGEYPTLNPVDP
jgi:EAL domain-containing protein (putative c-di-GMP-specific phosphodiesterase class I)